MTDSKKKRTRRRFSDEFKREAVELLRSSGITADQVSAELGVSTSLLYRWSESYQPSRWRLHDRLTRTWRVRIGVYVARSSF